MTTDQGKGLGRRHEQIMIDKGCVSFNKSLFFFFCLSLLSFRVVDPMLDSPILYRGGDSPLSYVYNYVGGSLTRTLSVRGPGHEQRRTVGCGEWM